MTDSYEIRTDVPVPETTRATGLSAAIRQMNCGDSIVVPANRIYSAHACARSVGAKVKTQSNRDGTATIWRIDEPVVIADRNIFGDPSLDASGNPIKPKLESIFE
jgi:hypothetical protein